MELDADQGLVAVGQGNLAGDLDGVLVQVLDPDRGIAGNGLGAERLGRNRLGLGRARRLPGGHHAGVSAGGGVEVLEVV